MGGGAWAGGSLGTGSKRANSSAGERPGAKAHFMGSEARILLIVAVKATSGAMEDGPKAAVARAGAAAPGVGGAKATAAARFCESHASCSERFRLIGSAIGQRRWARVRGGKFESS